MSAIEYPSAEAVRAAIDHVLSLAPDGVYLSSDHGTTEAAAILQAASAQHQVATLTAERERLTGEVAALRSWVEAYSDHSGYCAKEMEAMWECDCGFDDLLSEPFDLAAYQERVARDWLTEERLAGALQNPLHPENPKARAAVMWPLSERPSRRLAAALRRALFPGPAESTGNRPDSPEEARP